MTKSNSDTKQAIKDRENMECEPKLIDSNSSLMIDETQTSRNGNRKRKRNVDDSGGGQNVTNGYS